jgi:hypothetical protein
MRRVLWLIWFIFLVVISVSAQNDTVIFSVRGGFYDEVLPLKLYNIHPENHIRYTTNGSRPTAQSPLYEESLVLDQRLYSKSDIYTIVNCPEQDFFLPDSVPHCIVIRAAVFDENDSCVSRVMTQSFFISALGCDTHGLPAVSLCADSLDLFDYETGIFVPGINYDPLNPYYTGNYFMKGDDWERWSNFEFYELDNTGVNQQVGLRTHGKQSRWRGQKGLKIYARAEYGKKRLKHQFFETLPIISFKHLCLKPYGAAWNGSGCKDYIVGRMAQHINVESLSSRACALFLNGEYWGVYYVTEKPDERFLEDHLDVNIDSVNLINIWNDLECGNSDNFYALRTWMESADLSDEEQYAYAEARIDIANFIDYYVLELFSANLDWPAYNVRMWQVGDGKWRWIFYDGDACLEEQSFDVFANATYDGDEGYPSSRRATLFFRRLLENEHFREQFVSRFNELASTTFSYQNTKPYYDYIKRTLQGEVPNQIARFNMPVNYATWEYYCMAVIDQFLRERPEKIIVELNEILSVDGPMIQLFQCYPNPFSNEIHLGIDADDAFSANEIAIYDMMGREVFAQNFCVSEGQNEITIHPNLKNGVYLLKIGSRAIKIIRY